MHRISNKKHSVGCLLFLLTTATLSLSRIQHVPARRHARMHRGATNPCVNVASSQTPPKICFVSPRLPLYQEGKINRVRSWGALSQIFSKTQPLSVPKIGSSSSSLSSSVTSVRNGVSFSAPLLDAGYPPFVKHQEDGLNAEKPILLYLPGFDGTILAPFLQFPELGTTFDVRAMSVDMSDRSTFEQLRDTVVEYCLAESTTSSSGNQEASTSQKNQPPRPIYLVVESFGGLLASEVALYIEKLNSKIPRIDLKGIILVNPATSYDRSNLASLAPPVSELPALLYPLAIVQRLVPLFLDPYQLPQLLLILSSKRLPSIIDSPAREAYMGRTAFSLPQTLKFMPQDTLRWRLTEWLSNGCQALSQKRLEQLGKNMRTLIVAGELDETLPSVEEAERLKSIMHQSEVFVVEGAGHASTCGSRVDMAAVVRNRFPELQVAISDSDDGGVKTDAASGGRIKMKDVAWAGKEEYFGMEPRYNGEEVGLSPLLYWSPDLYRPWNGARSDD